MIEPELFDVVELLVPIPAVELSPGRQGAIVEDHGDRSYEVEFTNHLGETETLCTLSPDQFVVSEKVTAVVSALPENEQQQVLAFACSLHQSK
jgi:Domain of unknown function (DUF4926)